MISCAYSREVVYVETGLTSSFLSPYLALAREVVHLIKLSLPRLPVHHMVANVRQCQLLPTLDISTRVYRSQSCVAVPEVAAVWNAAVVESARGQEDSGLCPRRPQSKRVCC